MGGKEHTLGHLEPHQGLRGFPQKPSFPQQPGLGEKRVGFAGVSDPARCQPPSRTAEGSNEAPEMVVTPKGTRWPRMGAGMPGDWVQT